MPLGPQDKSQAAHGYGYDFHHTKPQRRIPCVKGDMLAPASADDIPPISANAWASVERGLELIADLLDDKDHSLYLGNADRDGKCTAAAQIVRLTIKSLRGVLRINPNEQRLIDALAAIGEGAKGDPNWRAKVFAVVRDEVGPAEPSGFDPDEYMQVWTLSPERALAFFGLSADTHEVVVLKPEPQSAQEMARYVPHARLYGIRATPAVPGAHADVGMLRSKP